ncbi:MAG: stage III sporulation protein AF [Clostridiales bacterium]|jgi:stage III sporulation protein AF|nr:stage III sporulation protein AF [Clostridiales bacterium]
MNFIKNYIMNILGNIVLGTLCELIMPKCSLKKYVEFTIGIIFIVSVLRPFCGINREEFKCVKVFDECAQLCEDKNIKKFCDNLNSEKINKIKVNRIFEKKMCEKVKETLREIIKDDFKLELKVCEDLNKMGEVSKLIINFSDKQKVCKHKEKILEILNVEFGINSEVIEIK